MKLCFVMYFYIAKNLKLLNVNFQRKKNPKYHHRPLFNASQGTMLMKKYIGIP
jgi:hypothetical protein